LPVLDTFSTALARCDASRALIIASAADCSCSMIDVPLNLPAFAITGSEPAKYGVITTWSPSTK
jgi:hypothetical protein